MPQHQQLTDIVLDEVSLVDKGANQHAHVILAKRADPVEKAATKREGGKDYPAGDFAYVPDSTKPSTWKLRLTSTPGGDPDPRIVGAAAAALGPGYRGQKVDVPAADLAAVKRKVAAAWRKANPDKKREDMPAVLKKSADDWTAEEVDEVLAKAMSFNEAFNNDVANDRLEELMEAFQRSIQSIQYDPEISNRSAAVAESAAQFHAAVAALAKEYDMSGNQDELMKQLTEKVTKMEADVADKDAQIAQLTADLEAATDPDGGTAAEIDKSALPEPVRKALEEAEAIKKRADAQELRIQKMEDERLEKSWQDKSGDAATGSLLFKVAKLDAGVAEEVHTVVKALHEQVKAAGLFKSFGSDAAGENETALEKVNKQATDFAKEHGVSHAVAVTKILEADPKLYAEYRAEQN